MSKNTTYTFVLLACSIVLIAGFGCNQKEKDRPSPLTSDSTSIEGISLKIVFSSPAVKERTIWNKLVPFNEVWRTGANEATYLTVSSDVEIEDHILPAGSYAIFTIPTDSTWTIIFNKEWNQWGAYNYNQADDVFRLEVSPNQATFSERMLFNFIDDQLVFRWENLSYSLDIKPK